MFMLRGGAGVGPAVRVSRGGGGVRRVRGAALRVVPARPARVAGERRATSTEEVIMLMLRSFAGLKGFSNNWVLRPG